MAKILDGKIVRDKIRDNLKFQISRQRRGSPTATNLKFKPKLVIIQIGDLPESNAYIRQKILFGERIGAIVVHLKLPKNTTQETINSQLSTLNSDTSVHGIIVQLPIPKHLDKDKIIEAIDPNKDVDGQTATNIKYLFENKNYGFIPATTKGILTLLGHYQIPVHGKNIIVVGRSSLVGKPTALALINLDATVTVCHSSTRKLPDKTKNADILIVAVGRPKLIKNFHVKAGQTVIDVGINAIDTDGTATKLVGDVDFDQVSKIVAAITPVPGGVGPMTVASLFENLLTAYKGATLL